VNCDEVNRSGTDQKYFGPYTEAHSVRNTLRLFEKIFKLRTCRKFIPREVKLNETEGHACLNFQINKCDAPCIGNISYEEYRDRIDQVILFLKGKTDAIIYSIKITNGEGI